MKDYSLKNDFLGELIGSYILVLFGTGAVAAAVLYDAHQSLFQIGMLWAFAVTFGIYMTRHLSNAHCNPAVSVAMVLTGRMSAKRLPTYIFLFTEGANVGRPNDNTAPILIGLTVGSLLCLLASITQAGMNPTRDFAPRLVAWMFGWGEAAFPDSSGGFFWVYILAPIVGGILAGYFFTLVLEPAMKKQKELTK